MGSGFKSALRACLHLLPDWMRRVIEDYREEESYEADGWPMQLMKGKARAAMWTVCTEMRVRAPGVAALACRLVERYLHSQMRHHCDESSDSREFQRFQQYLCVKLPMLMTSCVQIAAKSNSAATSLSATLVYNYLLRKGIHTTIQDIITWEYHVFQTIGYRVPLWTSVEVAELLAVQVQLPPALLEGLAIIVNLTEYNRDRLDKRVRWVANLSPESSNSSSGEDNDARSLTVRTLHLAAGAVAACARYFGLSSQPVLEIHLAACINVPRSYVECIRDSILAEAVIEKTLGKYEDTVLEVFNCLSDILVDPQW